MAVNPYFSAGSFFGSTPDEKSLYDQLCAESVQIFGVDVYYILRELVKEDHLFGEDVLSKFKDYHIVEMYLKNTEEFLGNDKMLDKFGWNRSAGIELDYTSSRFTEITGMDQPREGDLIYVPQFQRLFEINRAFPDSMNPYVGSISAELFTPSHEDIEVTDAADMGNLMSKFNIVQEKAVEENTTIQTEANKYLDFDENNPFGDWSK